MPAVGTAAYADGQAVLCERGHMIEVNLEMFKLIVCAVVSTVIPAARLAVS